MKHTGLFVGTTINHVSECAAKAKAKATSTTATAASTTTALVAATSTAAASTHDNVFLRICFQLPLLIAAPTATATVTAKMLHCAEC